MKENRKSLLVLAVKTQAAMLILKVEGKGSEVRMQLATDSCCMAQGRHSPGPHFASLSFPETTMSHICPMSHLKKLKELTGKALGKDCCESCCQSHSCTGTGKPAWLFPNCSPWAKMSLKISRICNQWDSSTFRRARGDPRGILRVQDVQWHNEMSSHLHSWFWLGFVFTHSVCSQVAWEQASEQSVREYFVQHPL